MSGKPQALYVDNAREFKSEALRRGCEQHGIAVDYRPLGRPHYGGIVERIIGTVMEQVHELPGTTFSNPAERGAYDAEKMAALTVAELERWLVLAVATYHGTVQPDLRPDRVRVGIRRLRARRVRPNDRGLADLDGGVKFSV